MQIVIDINEEQFNFIKENMTILNKIKDSNALLFDLCKCVIDGTQLGEHEKLVDLDQMCENFWDGGFMEIYLSDLKHIKTVLESNKQTDILSTL